MVLVEPSFFLLAFHHRGGFVFALSFSNTFSLAKYSGIMRSEASILMFWVYVDLSSMTRKQFSQHFILVLQSPGNA